jgi:hypothetical protein
MAAPSTIVSTLGELVVLLQNVPDPAGKATDLLNRFAAAQGSDSIGLSADGFGLSLDGTPLPAGTPGAEELFDAFRRHRVGRLTIAAGAPASAVLATMRALAGIGEPGGGHDAVAREAGLEVAGPIRLEGPRRLPKASDTIQLDGPIGGATLDPDTRALLDTENRMLRDVFPDLETLESAKKEASAAVPPPPISSTSQPRGPASKGAEPRSFMRASLPELLDRLETGPDAREAGVLLQHVTDLARRAADQKKFEDVLAAGASLLRAESKASTPESARRYDASLRRILSRPTLQGLVPLVITGAFRAEGFPIFRRGGAEATDVLLDFLAAAPTMDERAAAFRALQTMTEGTQSIVHMLSADAWYVLRNVAELCGVMGLAAAAPGLARLLSHEDERVRRAAAGALARLDGPDAMEGTRRALRDASPIVRLDAAKAIGGARSRGMAMTIALALEEGQHADVERELLLALGRIGTPEAVQALGKAAEPGGRFRGRKTPATRLAAIEGLKVAGGQGAQRLLLSLASDPDRAVGQAASRALDAIAG